MTTDVYPSAAVAHQLKVSLLVCPESDILQTLLLTTGYVSYCYLLAIANQEIPGDQKLLKSSGHNNHTTVKITFLLYSEAQFEL